VGQVRARRPGPQLSASSGVDWSIADIAGPAVRRFLTCLILLNVAAVVLETVASLEAAAGPVFTAIEVVSVGIFSLEYVLRGWAAPEQPAYQGPFGRLRWMRSSGALVDLLAVLPLST